MAERVGFEPTVPLPRRMLSKHVDSSTLAPLRIEKCKGGHLNMRVQQQQGDQRCHWASPFLGECRLVGAAVVNN